MIDKKQVVGCPNCGTENTFDSNNQNKLFCQECGKDLTKYVIAENNTSKAKIYEQTLLCQKCGQVISNDSDFCPFCGNEICRQTSLNVQKVPLESLNSLGYIIKSLFFVITTYFLYFGYNTMFKTVDTASEYSIDYVLLKQGINTQYFVFGLGVFLLLFLLITVVYAEIILHKLARTDKKVEKLSKNDKE